mgnify:CR=1 FL=1
MAYLAELDTRLLLYIQDAMRYEPLHSFWRGISFWATWAGLDFTGILLALNSKTRTAGITAIAALVLSTFISNVILKNAVMRPRPFEVLPQIIPLITHASGYSFPSGHTTAAFACAFVYYKLLPKFFGLPIMLLAVMVAFSRLYLGVHYPLDVLGGIITALVWQYACN